VFLDSLDEYETTFYVSPRLQELTGFSPQEWIEDPLLWQNQIYEEDRERILEAARISHQQGGRFAEEYRFVCKDGRVIWLKEDTNLIRDGNGAPLYWQGILIDITKEKENERALQRQLQELRILNAITLAGTEITSEDEIIERVLQVVSVVYNEVCGVLMLNEQGDRLFPHSSYVGANIENWKDGSPITQGVTGKAVRLGTSIRLGDITQEPSFIEIAEGMRSELCVPIRVNKKIIGVFNVESKRPNAFDEEDEQFLETVAGTLGTALENARLYETERRRRVEAESLREATASLSAHIELEPLLEQILTSAQKIVPYDSASIFLGTGEGDMEIVAVRGFPPDAKLIGKKVPKTAKWTELFDTRHPMVMADAQADPRFEKWDVSEIIRGWMGVPMITQDQVVGFINLDSHRPNAFTERDVTLIQTFANSAAVAIQNAILFKAEREQRQREESMLELMRVTTSTLELNKIMQTILQHMLSLIPSDSGTIQLLEGDKLRIAATQGFSPGVLRAGQILSLQDSILKQRAVQTRQPVWTNNTRQDPDYKFIEGAEEVNSFMVIPLIYKGEVIGLATLDSRQTNRYTAEDAEFAFAIANQATIAIGNARLYQEAVQASERRAILHRISQDIVRFTQDTEQIYAAIHEAAAKLMPCDVFLITLINNDKTEITAVYAVEAGTRYSPESVPARKGFSADIINNGKSVILKDTPDIEQTRAVRFGSPKRVRSVVAVPMRIGEKVIGMISAQSYEPNAYDEEEQVLLEMLATHAATAIENARLFQEESRRTQIIETMVEIANEIATTQDIMPVLDKITQRTLELLRANHVAIYLLHDDNRTLKVIAAQGKHRSQLLSQTIKIGEGITGSVVASGKAEIIDLVARDSRRVHLAGTPEEEAEYETMMSVPLILRGRRIGAVNAWRLRANGVFSPVELSFLTSIANQVSVAIESSNLFKEIVRRAQEAAAIAEVGRDISATLQLDVVLNKIAAYARELLNSESSAVYLPDSSKPILKAIAAQGAEADQIRNFPLEIGRGILGSIALNKSGEIVNNTERDPRAIVIEGTASNPHEHIMGVPVMEKDQLTGLVVVWRSGVDNEYKISDLNFLESLAQQAAAAIKNARLYDEAQRRLKEVETINRLSSSLRATQSQTEMCNILLDETLDLLQAHDGAVWIHDPATNLIVQRAARGVATQTRYKHLRPDQGIVGHVLTTGKTYISPALKQDPLLFSGNRDVIREGYAGSGVPIKSSDGILGVLMVHIESNRRVEDSIHLLETLAEITGNAIHRADLFEQSQEQVRKLTTLRDIDSAIASSTDLRVTLNILMDHTLRHLKVDAVDILLYHPDLQSLTYLCSAGFRSASPTRPLMRLGEGLAGQVVMKGRIELIPDLQAAGEIGRDPLLIREGFVSYIGVPLIVKGQIKGLFEIFSRAPLAPTEDWMQFMQTLTGQAAIAIDNSQLFENLQRSNQEIRQAYDTTLEGWARALELRDRETEGHTRRVTRLTMDLARYMNVSEDSLVNIYRGVLLHDIGKMGVPDQILRKTGPLTDTEWTEMRKHPQYAFDLLSPIPYLRPALDIPYCHHEHWDGSGYPRGLKGEQIPLAARIFSVVDIWDALLSDRPYRKAWSREKVIAYIKEISGTILDPQVVEAFLKMLNEQEANNKE
jgi:PAS domain S-box-containing protein